MHSDHYLHPEFGCLSPTQRLRRELRTAFFSVLFGLGIGAAATIALNGNNNTDDSPLPRRVGALAASAIMEPPDAVTGHNSLQAARVEDKVNSGQIIKSDEFSADANSKNRKINATTTCEGSEAACLNIPLRTAKPRGMQMRAANDAVAIARTLSVAQTHPRG